MPRRYADQTSVNLNLHVLVTSVLVRPLVAAHPFHPPSVASPTVVTVPVCVLGTVFAACWVGTSDRSGGERMQQGGGGRPIGAIERHPARPGRAPLPGQHLRSQRGRRDSDRSARCTARIFLGVSDEPGRRSRMCRGRAGVEAVQVVARHERPARVEQGPQVWRGLVGRWWASLRSPTTITCSPAATRLSTMRRTLCGLAAAFVATAAGLGLEVVDQHLQAARRAATPHRGLVATCRRIPPCGLTRYTSKGDQQVPRPVPVRAAVGGLADQSVELPGRRSPVQP